MYTVIMGGGRVGLNLASALVSVGHDVTLIENDKTLCGNAASELDALVIHGNGTNTKILEGASISEAKVLWQPQETMEITCLLLYSRRIMMYPR